MITRCSEHITPVLRSLHWLSVRQRITFKVATIVHKCLNSGAPVYLSNDLQYAGQCRTGVRSASAALLEVPRSRTAIGDRSFSIAGPRVWNTLPASVRDINSSLRFRKLLKAFLFVRQPRRRWRLTGAFKIWPIKERKAKARPNTMPLFYHHTNRC